VLRHPVAPAARLACVLAMPTIAEVEALVERSGQG
jgi:hypothetical protein